jgi:phage/plasmid-like protein (TIGR03299 family)
MAHEIEIVNGKANMAYAASGGKPWHGLGTPVDDKITPIEMMKAANLDWTVSKKQTFVEIDGENVYTGQDALVRSSDNAILDVVGEGWNPVQNEEAFDFFHDFVSKGNMKMDTAGSLRGGKIVWALAKINSGFTLFNGDEVKGYLLFTNPHQYGKSIDVRTCMERVVCNNTLTVALNENSKNVAKINHRSVFNADRVKAILGIADTKVEKFKEAAEFLGSKRYRKTDLLQFYGDVFGRSEVEGKDLSRTGEQVMALLETQPGAEYQAGTFWQVFNSVTFATDHILGRGNDTRLDSAWFGQNSLRKQKALNLALEMAAKV